MLEPGSSLNIISLLVLEAVGIPRDKTMKQPIEVSGFGGNIYTLGFENPYLTARPMRAVFWLYVLVLHSYTTYCWDTFDTPTQSRSLYVLQMFHIDVTKSPFLKKRANS